MEKEVWIYSLTERWVLVGRVAAIQPDPLFVSLEKCAVIRNWGTTKGLAELAADGPTKNTMLDTHPGKTLVRVTDIRFAVECNREAWRKW